MLSSCGAVVHESFERMKDNDRFASLSSMTDAQLCSGYNNYLLQPNTERDIENILKQRKIGRCDARGKIRTISLDTIPNATDDFKSKDLATIVNQPTPTTPTTPTTTTETLAEPNTPKTTLQKTIIFESKEAAIKDIENMLKENLNRNSFESIVEYEKRRKNYIDQFSKTKGYRLTFPINNPNNDSRNLINFNPDTEELTISLPSISRKSFYFNSDPKMYLNYIHYSFVEIISLNHPSRTYKASNRLGASIDVVETGVTRWGFAVLSQATKDSKKDLRQKFTFPIKANEAREILKNGKITLEFALDTQYPNRLENPFIYVTRDQTKPSFENPIDHTEKIYALPVRLLNVHLLNKTGVTIFSAPGQQIEANPITN